MTLTTLLRPPLVWLVLVEAALIAALGAVTWHVWQQRIAPAPAVVAEPAPPHPAATSKRPGPIAASPGASPSPAAPSVGPTPGIRTDAAFLSREMAELNRVEAAFEDLEWRVTKAVADGIQRYIEGVVLPSIDHGQGSRR